MIGKVSDLIAFALMRGVIISEPEAPLLLQSATDYLNAQEWVGEQADLLQDDAWPRINFTSPGGAFFDGSDQLIAIARGEYILDPVTPRAVVNAAYQLAIAAMDEDLMPMGGGAETTRETVGPITVEYSGDSLGAEPSFSWWDSLLGKYLDYSGGSACNVDVYRG